MRDTEISPVLGSWFQAVFRKTQGFDARFINCCRAKPLLWKRPTPHVKNWVMCSSRVENMILLREKVM